MLGALPALFIAACMAALWAVRHRLDQRWGGRFGLRDAGVLALLAAGAWSAIGGELLSLGAALTFWPVLAWWTLPTAALGALAFARRNALRHTLPWRSPRHSLTPPLSVPVSPVPPQRPDRVTLAFMVLTAGLLLATGLIALLTPPNATDALAYHLPRQIMWSQQGSLAHYPSHDLRQLEFPPMAESASVQMMILAGGDRWANMVQWGAYLGCVVIASLMARGLGAGARGQALSALLVATIPSAAQMSVNAKNDIVVALWACLLAYLGLRVRLERRCGPAGAVLVGLSLGLLLYTKGTGYVFAIPLVALLGVWMLRSLRLGAVPAALLIGVVAAGLNAGHWWRNYDAFGHPLGLSATGKAYRLANETHSVPALVSNVVRNLTLHTRTPSGSINAAQERWVASLHEALGIDPDDPRTSYASWGNPFFIGWRLWQSGAAGAPVHVLLVLLTPFALLWPGRRVDRFPAAAPIDPPGGGPTWGMFAAGVGMFLVFCFVVKWQPWHARMHVTILALLAPVCGVALSRAPGGAVKGLFALGAFALVAGALTVNHFKPLFGEWSVFRVSREDARFFHRPPLREAALAALGAAAEFRPRVIGLAWGFKHQEYPVQHVLLDHASPPVRLVSGNPSLGPAPSEDARPDVILAFDATETRFVPRPGAGPYLAVAQFPPITVYVRSDLASAGNRVGAPGADLPFIGWRAVEGLGPSEGPFRDRNIPVVVYPAMGPKTRLTFDGTGWGGEAELVLECRRIGSDEQTMDVLLNGERIFRHVFGRTPVLTAHRIPLTPREGPNEIEIRFGTTFTVGPQERAMLYRKIQIIPRSPGGGRIKPP